MQWAYSSATTLGGTSYIGTGIGIATIACSSFFLGRRMYWLSDALTCRGVRSSIQWWYGCPEVPRIVELSQLIEQARIKEEDAGSVVAHSTADTERLFRQYLSDGKITDKEVEEQLEGFHAHQIKQLRKAAKLEGYRDEQETLLQSMATCPPQLRARLSLTELPDGEIDRILQLFLTANTTSTFQLWKREQRKTKQVSEGWQKEVGITTGLVVGGIAARFFSGSGEVVQKELPCLNIAPPVCPTNTTFPPPLLLATICWR